MVRKRKNLGQNKKGVKFFSGIFFIAGLGVLVMIGISLGKETYRKRQIQREVENLQAEISKVNQENSDLANLISYLSSQEFQEKEAREKLNLQKEDEKMIVLRKEMGPQNGEKSGDVRNNSQTQESKVPNWRKWLEFFFAKRS